jgi:hypothetical protein
MPPCAWPSPPWRDHGRRATRAGPTQLEVAVLDPRPSTAAFRRIKAAEIATCSPPAGSRGLLRLPWAMDRRIFGIETEYGVTCTFHGQRRLSPDEVARYLFRKVVSWGRSSNVFLRNGARLYLDVGSHPEYATPECDDIAARHPRQGGGADPRGPARRRRAPAARRGHRRRGLPVQEQHRLRRQLLRLPRELPVGRHGEFSRLADVLIPFLVSRQIICGAGKVLQTPRGAVFCVSQRAEHIWEGSPAPPPAPGRSSTPATSRTPTPSASAGCT